MRGYVASVPSHRAPLDSCVGNSQNVLVNPFDGSFYRRAGQSIQGDTLSGTNEVTGLLETRFSGKCRQMLELESVSLTDGLSVPSALVTAEGNAAPGAYPDTGWQGAHYLRDITGAVNYVLGMEFGTTHYPSAGGLGGNQLDHKWVPLWCESGDGLYNRGASAFSRSLLFGGARRMLDASSWRHFPGLHSTPANWNRRFNTATGAGTEPNRLRPSGSFGPMYPPVVGSPVAVAGSDAAWTAGDTFFVSVIFQFEDGSFSAPFLPRAINSRLTAGLGFVTIGTIASGTKYQAITWSKIPKGPDGTIARILLRSPKQNLGAATDVLTISAADLRICGVLRNNTQTSYVDTLGTDTGLIVDANVVRLDHVSPRRARYIGTGDQRALIGYTLPSPCAIIVAPTAPAGGTTRQLNSEDTDLANFLGAFSMLVRIKETAGTASHLELHYIAGASGAPNSTSFAFATYTTLQDLVDAINATAVGGTGGEWCATLAPGVDGSLASTNLCVSTRDVTGTKCTSGSPILTAGTFTAVPVGAVIYDTTAAFPAGTYVLSKQGATSITMSANATATDAVGHTAVFYSDVGDELNVTGGTHGYLRAFCPALPVHVYLKTSAQLGYDRPDKQTVYFTVSSPGAASSGVALAANAFVSGNRRNSSAKGGILMGFVDIEQAAVVAYSKSIKLFINQRGVVSGEDFDYRLLTINERRGCIAWGTLVAGDGWASYLTFQGIAATDKTRREVIISNDLHNPTNRAGVLSGEITKSLQGSRVDDDTSYCHMVVMESQLHLNYRSSTGQSRPNKRIVYDFGPGVEASGLDELAPQGRAFGWSAPLTNPPTAMVEIARSSGLQRYGWRDTNAGATGDGRLQLLDDSSASSMDDAATYSSPAFSPVVPAPPFSQFSAKRVVVRHLALTATSSLYFARDKKAATTAALTLAVDNTTDYLREQIELPLSQRTNGEAVQFQWSPGQEDGQALWEVELDYELAAQWKAA